MGEALDIQNLLQAGYYTTTRAKSSREPSPIAQERRPFLAPAPSRETTLVRTSQATQRPRKPCPPPPSVEDEAVSLAREYGGRPSCNVSNDEPPSKGDLEQNPIIMEVHEYNPERRFVILTKSTDESDASEPSKKAEPPRTEPPKPEPPKPEPTKTSRTSRTEKPTDGVPYESTTSRRFENNLKPSTGRRSRESSRPPLEKRKSRQDLPRLNTETRNDRSPDNSNNSSRSRPAGGRPEPPYPRPAKQSNDPPSQPDVLKHGSNGREKYYSGSSKSQSGRTRSPNQRSQPNATDDRRYDDSYARASSTSRRNDSNVDSTKSSRPLSGERVGDSRDRGGYSSSRPKKDVSPTHARPEREDPGRSSKYQTREPAYRREDTRSGDDHPRGPRELQPRRKKSIIHQEGRESLPNLDKVDAPTGPRVRPKGPGIPIPVPVQASPSDSVQKTRSPSAFPQPREEAMPIEHVERPKATQLPYPVDDNPMMDPFSARGNPQWPGRTRFEPEASVSMPEIPTPVADPLPELPRAAPIVANTDYVNLPSQPWQPPPFEPKQEGLQPQRPAGTYRRYSECADTSTAPQFPECPRKHPVAGKVDWLTLPRTDFNICPDCYSAVFGNTEYRSLFQPMLRSATRPIACDFGIYPWYRIAWLLTLKKNLPNLQLFHDIAHVISTTHDLPCPGDRKTVRNWQTIWNPQSRRPVHDFAICTRCADIIQVLLPNLTGAFIPLDARSEATRDICAMRFKPKRKRFVMYFDAMEFTSDQARQEQEEPDMQTLAKEIENMTAVGECHEDTPLVEGHWHTMQFLKQFSVCGECFDEVVRPLVEDENVIARNFHAKPQRLPVASCQLYSIRMRDVFRKACRWNDPKYLEGKVQERLDIEAVIHDKLAKLDKSEKSQNWVDEQVDNLIQEWKRWE